MPREIRDYPWDTLHPEATAGILPPETRKVMLDAGWLHDSEVCAITNTKLTGRRRWEMPSAMIGNERYYRVSDVMDRLEQSYEEHAESLATRAAEKLQAASAIA